MMNLAVFFSILFFLGGGCLVIYFVLKSYTNKEFKKMMYLWSDWTEKTNQKIKQEITLFKDSIIQKVDEKYDVILRDTEERLLSRDEKIYALQKTLNSLWGKITKLENQVNQMEQKLIDSLKEIKIKFKGLNDEIEKIKKIKK